MNGNNVEMNPLATDFPKLFFKYRSLSRKEDLTRLLEQISEQYLYFPTREKLNDPFEGMIGDSSIVGIGYAGVSLRRIYGQEIPPIKDLADKYRILSLSATCFSPLMWAFYGDKGEGACLCFQSSKSLHSAQPVVYSEANAHVKKEMSKEELDAYIRSCFFKKHPDWAYEKEWRIVEKTDSDRVRLNNELISIILGNKVDPKDVLLIKQFLPPNVQLFRTHIDAEEKRIRLLRDGYEFPFDGLPAEFINTTDELYNAILKGNPYLDTDCTCNERRENK